ncbi:LysE family transporter [Stenotrophomonas sp. NPDC087984]
MTLLNPKAILFFISFFVQLVDPDYAHPALSFLALGAWAQLFSITYLSVLIFSGTYLAATFRRRRRLRAGRGGTARDQDLCLICP